MTEYRIEFEGGKQLAVSRQRDGQYSFRLFSSTGYIAAHLIASQDEGEKLTDAMNNLRHKFDLQINHVRS